MICKFHSSLVAFLYLSFTLVIIVELELYKTYVYLILFSINFYSYDSIVKLLKI